MMPNQVVFDIETIPDTEGLRLLYGLDNALSAAEVAEMAFHKRRASVGHDFMPLHLQRIVVISCLLRTRDGIKIFSLAEPDEGEGRIIQRFYDGVEKFTPQLISWNGGGFDLPVLHYRGLIHGVTAPRYWDMGESGGEFRFNNYISRYHMRHLDLMDLLALYQPRASVPLDELAKLMGYPGKLGMDGGKVWQTWLEGRHQEIRDYCETDVMNTYLVSLNFRKMRGELSAEEWQDELVFVRQSLEKLSGAHWKEFLDAWK